MDVYCGNYGRQPSTFMVSSLMRGTGLLTLYHGLIFTMIIVSLVRKYGTSYLRQILTIAFISGVLVAASVWFGDEGFNFPIQMLQRSGGGGTIGNSSLAAAYLLFVLGFGSVLLAMKELAKDVKRWIAVGVGLIIFSPLFINLQAVLTGRGVWGSARGATIGMFVALGVAALTFFAFSNRKIIKLFGISGIIGGGVVFVVLWMKLLTPGSVIHEGFVKAASGTRFLFWDIATKVLHERPIFGYGPENYTLAVQHYFNPKMLDRSFSFEVWTDRAHNIYFDTGVAGGYPAIILYTFFVLSLCYMGIIAYRHRKITRTQLAVFCGLVAGYVFQNLFVFDGVMSLFTLFILTGVLVAFTGIEDDSIGENYVLKGEVGKLVLASALGIGFCFVWYLCAYLPAQKARLFGEVLSAPINIKMTRYPELLKGSPVGDMWDVGGFAHDTYRFYAQDPLKVKNDKTLLPYAQKDVLAFTHYAEEVAKRSPQDYRLYLSIIHLYSTYIFFTDMPYNKDIADTMLRYAEHAKTLAPGDPQIYWAFGQIAAWKGDFQGVINAYQQAIDIDPTLPVGHRLLIGFLTDIKANKLATEALANAKKAIPNFSMN